MQLGSRERYGDQLSYSSDEEENANMGEKEEIRFLMN